MGQWYWVYCRVKIEGINPIYAGDVCQGHPIRQNGNKEQTYSAVVQQKNLISASSNSPGAPPKINEMLDYITATMDTLNNFKQHLTTLQDTNPTHSEMC